jgi:hypothetical protein
MGLEALVGVTTESNLVIEGICNSGVRPSGGLAIRRIRHDRKIFPESRTSSRLPNIGWNQGLPEGSVMGNRVTIRIAVVGSLWLDPIRISISTDGL